MSKNPSNAGIGRAMGKAIGGHLASGKTGTSMGGAPKVMPNMGKPVQGPQASKLRSGPPIGQQSVRAANAKMQSADRAMDNALGQGDSTKFGIASGNYIRATNAQSTAKNRARSTPLQGAPKVGPKAGAPVVAPRMGMSSPKIGTRGK